MNRFTKKIFFLFVLALAGIGSANAQRIYGSELKAVKTDAGYDLSFTLNAPATGGEIILTPTDGSNSIVTIPFSGALSTGRNTVSVDKSKVTPNVKYTWAVKATGAPVSNPVKFTDETKNLLLNFFTAGSFAIDNSFESPYFGRMYVSSNYNTGAAPNGRGNTSPGIYVLDAALSDVTGQGNTAYAGNVAWVAGQFTSPDRDCVGGDGKVYIGDYKDALSNVWIMDPANPQNDFQQAFGGAHQTSGLYLTDAGVYTGGSNIALCATGVGANAKLFTLDEDYGTTDNPFGLTLGGNVLVYNVGTGSIPWMTAPSGIMFDNAAQAIALGGGGFGGKILYNPASATIASDNRGGFWICQNRAANGDNQAVPSVVHVSLIAGFGGNFTYFGDYNSGDPAGNGAGVFGASQGGALSVTSDGNMLALQTLNGDYKVYNVSYDTSGAPTLTQVYDINSTSTPASVGTINDLKFDAAGNLYVLTTSTVLVGYALPITDNTFTSSAPSTQVLDFSGTGIVTPKVAQLQVYPNPVQDIVHVNGVGIESIKVIDLTGRTVMDVPVNKSVAPVDVNLSGISSGNYIILVNNTPVKIEKK